MKRTGIIALAALGAAAVIGLVAFRVNYVVLNDCIYRKDIDSVHLVDLAKTHIPELNRCRDLEYLSAENGTDEHLAQLDALPKLECIYLHKSDIGAEGMRKLSEFPALTDVLLTRSHVDAAGLNSPCLAHLMFREGELTNAEALAGCKALRSISIDCTAVEGAVICEDGACILTDSTVLGTLDQITYLGIYGTEIRDISGILDMDSLEMLRADAGMLTAEQTQELEAQGIIVEYNET